MKKIVAVLYGGRSGEHEISVRSAKSIVASLDREKYEVREFFITRNGEWQPGPLLPQPGANGDIDVVFPALHGTFGEDGTMQGLLELADLPYVGPGVLASALAMDKEVMKRVCKAHGLPVVAFLVQYRGALDPASAEAAFGYPVFVKPANLGSSVGVAKAKNREQLEEALASAAEFDTKIIIEQAVTGREFECAVLGNDPITASVPCEILPSREFYDYDDKYLLDKAVIELPAKLSADQTAEMQRLAVAACRACEVQGMSRVDFLMDGETGAFYVNEVNTIPGFTSISMYPKMWEYSGVPYPELLDRLISLAIARHETKKATRYSK
ncbi:MAG TPA: D-alanine--D-alanine ligase family protein [Bryobacteraceae bacterium]|nr:D-alanine--D-alanine ligase family protein [Bryobacteraceae bacterium]